MTEDRRHLQDGVSPQRLHPHRLVFDREQPVQECIAVALLLHAIILSEDGAAFWSDSLLCPSVALHRAIHVGVN